VGLTLDVLSITREVPDLDLGTRDRLALSWSRPMAALQLRVMSKDHDAPYRMDAQPKDGTRSFVWNLDVLKRQHTAVGRSLELAALGFAAFGIASDKKPAHAVWTPIAFEGSAKASPDIVVTLSTSARVYKVFSTLASETPGGVQTVAWEDRCERSKTLQAHSPIEIRIPVPDAAPHLYNLEVRASGESGLTSSTLEILGR
jgi:hypothetical protein